MQGAHNNKALIKARGKKQMSKKQVVVTLDLDGTILWADGSVYPGNAEAIKKLVAAGFRVLLHTDTSEEGLRRHMIRLGLTREHIHGIIPENGAYIKCWGEGLPLDRQFAPDFKLRRGQFRRLRIALIERFCELGWDVDLTHPATTAPLMHGLRLFSPVRVFIDVTRQASFTAEVRAMTDEGLTVDEARTGEVSAIVREEAELTFGAALLDSSGDVLQRPEFGDGWIMLPGFGLSKATPLQYLVETGFEEVWHVGDGSNEVPTALVTGVTTVAMGTGCSFYRKGRPRFVTKADGPRGFVEAMDMILAAHKLAR